MSFRILLVIPGEWWLAHRETVEQAAAALRAALIAAWDGLGDAIADRLLQLGPLPAPALIPDDYEQQVAQAIREHVHAIALQGAHDALSTVGLFNLPMQEVPAVARRLGQRITQINQTTVRLVQATVTRKLAEGTSIPDLARELRQQVPAWTERRATTIARTESALAYNWGTLYGIQKANLTTYVKVFDGDGCGWTRHDDPDKAHNSIRTLAEAEQYPLAHPNCRRAFAAYYPRDLPIFQQQPQLGPFTTFAGIPLEEYQRIDIPSAAEEALTRRFRAFYKKMSPDHVAALRDYTGMYYREINRILRTGEAASKLTQQRIDRMTDLFRQAPPISEPLRVFRGVKPHHFPTDDIGTVKTYRGFTSTSLHRRVAEGFSEGMPVLEILIPPGATALYLKPVSDYPKEFELLLPHNAKYVILDKRADTIVLGLVVEEQPMKKPARKKTTQAKPEKRTTTKAVRITPADVNLPKWVDDDFVLETVGYDLLSEDAKRRLRKR